MGFLSSLTGIMSFTGVFYLLFLTLAVIVFFILPGARTRSIWLLAISSFFFLLYSPSAYWVIIAVTLVAYGMGLVLGRMNECEEEHTGRKRLVLIVGILISIAALLVCKYGAFTFNVIEEVARALKQSLQLPLLKLIMPIGISFWTFQTVAYIVDVYKKKTPPVRNLLFFAASVIFFPTITMGPITKIQTLVPQLNQKYRFSYDNMRSGLLLMGWGYFKKLMVADRLAIFVGTVFDHPHNYSGTVNGMLFLVAAVFYAIQLYTDFSGYTDIVRGSARLFGVTLPENFRAPYFSRSVGEFWRRWHITLMDWLKEYIYIPLGGNRKGKARKYVNVMAVFLVSGIWHGAGWTFIVWGLLNGFYQLAGAFLAPLNKRVTEFFHIDRESSGHRVFQTVCTFLLITIAWVFFRAGSISDALYMIPRMFMPTFWIFTDGSMLQQGLGYSELIIALASIVLVWVIDYLKFEKGRNITLWLVAQPLYFRWFVYYALIFTIVIFGQYGGTYNAADFVYFKF